MESPLRLLVAPLLLLPGLAACKQPAPRTPESTRAEAVAATPVPAAPAVAAAAPAPAPLPAPARRSLAECVPEDVHVFSMGEAPAVPTAEDKRIYEAFARFGRSGVYDDLLDFALAVAPKPKHDMIREQFRLAREILGKVAWMDLFSGETAFAERIRLPMPEIALLLRPQAGKGSAAEASLKTLLGDLAALAPDQVELRDAATDPTKFTTLALKRAEIELGIHMAREGDLIVVSMSRPLASSILRLAAKGTGERSLARSPRFRDGSPELTGAAGGGRLVQSVYADLSFIGGIADMVGTMAMTSSHEPEESESSPAQPRLDGKRIALDALTVVMHEVASLRTVRTAVFAGGSRATTETVFNFDSTATEEGFLAKILASNRKIERFERFVPADALSFKIAADRDPAALYDSLVSAMREQITAGSMLLAQWEKIQQGIGFNLRQDLLAWLSGDWVCVDLPGNQCVFLAGVKEPAEAGRQLDRALGALSGFLSKRRQPLTLRPAVGIATLKVAELDAFPDCRPVVGVDREWLVVASSEAAYRRVRSTMDGAAPTILENADFKKLGLKVDGPASWVRYSNVDETTGGIGRILAAAGFFCSLVPEERDTRQTIKMGPVLTKVGRLLSDLDMPYRSACWISPILPDGTMRAREVTSVKSE